MIEKYRDDGGPSLLGVCLSRGRLEGETLVLGVARFKGSVKTSNLRITLLHAMCWERGIGIVATEHWHQYGVQIRREVRMAHTVLGICFICGSSEWLVWATHQFRDHAVSGALCLHSVTTPIRSMNFGVLFPPQIGHLKISGG